MNALARDNKIKYLEFHNEDGIWFTKDVWMYDNANIGALMHKANDLEIAAQPFVIECSELQYINGVYYCDASVQPVETPYNRKTYERDPAYKSMETSVRFTLKESGGGVGVILGGLAIGFIWWQFKK